LWCGGSDSTVMVDDSVSDSTVMLDDSVSLPVLLARYLLWSVQCCMQYAFHISETYISQLAIGLIYENRQTNLVNLFVF
jgi:hypothetical protein